MVGYIDLARNLFLHCALLGGIAERPRRPKRRKGCALEEIQFAPYGTGPVIDDQSFKTIGVQLKALGLVNITYSKAVGGGMGLFWSATPSGERLTLELRTVRTKPKKPTVSPPPS